jgi:hypothetical protein
MNEQNLPRHILDKMERRWASRIARDAAAWEGGKQRDERREIGDRAGRLVPVTSRRNLVFQSQRLSSSRNA